jgi:uncharacterized membrane-anchored protein YhcB (DUF1043 family)
VAGNGSTVKVTFLGDASSLVKAGRQAENATDGVGGKLGKLGGLAKGAGLAVAAGLAVGAVAAVKFAADAVSLASQAEQSMGAVESVFGKAASAVVKFTDDSAMRLGLSKNDYREMAAVVGSQLQSMGKSQAESAKQTDVLIGMGADLAATFGGSVSDAVSAVGSLLRGERDPIERYGIAIKDADIKARLAALGQDKLTGAALKTATANATLSLLTEQSKNSLGAFGREANTLAGTQERLRARLDDVKTSLGERLLPIVTKFATYVLNEGVPALERFIAYIDRNRDGIIRFGEGMLDFGLTVANVVLAVGQGWLKMVSVQLGALASMTGHIRSFLNFFFDFADSILSAASKAFGWIPGVGDKIDGARSKLGELQSTANARLSSVERSFAGAARSADKAAATVGNVRSAVDRLRDKTFTITTIQKTVYTAQRDGKGGGVQARAHGGPVLPGQPYLVGEEGPELIVPSRAGHVLTAKETAARTGATTNYNLTVQGTLDASVNERTIQETFRRMELLAGTGG